MNTRVREPLRLVLLFLLLLAAFAYFNRDNNRRDHSVESRMALVKAMVDDQRFDIDAYHNSLFSTSDKAFSRGHYYSDKAIGVSLLGGIVYKWLLWLGAHTGWVLKFKYFRDVITILAVSILAALIGPLLYVAVKRINPAAAAGPASLMALALALGTPYFKFSSSFYGHALAGLFLFAAFMIWFIYRQSQAISGPRIFLSGFLLGWAVITEYPTVLLAAAVGLYALFVLFGNRRLADWKPYALMGAGALIPLSFLLIYNQICFGNPFNLSYGYEATKTFHLAHSAGLFGVGWPNLRALFYMTIHPSMGIFWQSPLLLLAVPGWVYLFRSGRYRAEAWFTLLLVTFYFVFHSGYYMWWGYSFTPRHIIPVLPFFILPLAILPRRYLPFLGIAAALSIAQMLIVAAGNSDGLPQLLLPAFQAGTLASPPSIIYSIYLPNVLHGIYVHNLGETLFGLRGAAQFLPLALFESVIALLLIALSVQPERAELAASSEAI
ncbi:MAG: hypothetical protein ACM3QS_17820 [Bacteroidota bacterium]